MRALPTIAALLAVLALAPALPAQDRPLVVHHGFPEAGHHLAVAAEGFVPGAFVVVMLEDAASAPPSVGRQLIEQLGAVPDERGALTTVTSADGAGVLSLDFALDDPDDAGRFIALSLAELDEPRAETRVTLLVQPPMLWVPTDGAVARIDLRDGSLLQPPIPGDGGLLGAALSADGVQGWLLRPGGVLEVRAADRWDTLLRLQATDAAGAALGRSPARGPLFVLARPSGGPFAPPGRLQFVDGRRPDLLLEPLGQPVEGRRWAVSGDGLTAFVAEDDLLVREVDLLSGAARGVFTAGVPGDRSIADLAVVDDRLLVLTRRTGGRTGTLTVEDLRTGRLDAQPLRVDPLRLVTLEGGQALVVPAAGGLAERVQDGVPGGQVAVPGHLLDAAPVTGGALLLATDGDGARSLLTWDGSGPPRALAAPVPQATRLVSAGGDVAILLGAPDGRLYRVEPASGTVGPIPGVVTEAAPPYAVLP